ncbi:MAG: type II secretion system F family protein [Gaiellales bacterium]
MRRLRGAALACVLVLAAGASTAAAATPPVTIKKIDTSNYPTVKVTIVTSKPGAPSSLDVTENGQPAAGVKVSGAAGAAIALAIDTSGSMHGQKIADAIAAAKTFVFGEGQGTRIAVYGFGHTAYQGAPFADNPTMASNALGQLGTDSVGGTAIYSSVVQASDALSSQHVDRRTLVLLTDGASVGEKTTLAQAVQAAKAAHVTIYAVATGANADLTPLKQLTGATGGQVIAGSDRQALVAAYAQIAASVGSESTFTYHSLVLRGAKITLQVSADGSAAATASATAPGHQAVTKPSSGGINLPNSPAGRAVVAGVAALFVLLAALVLLSARPPVTLGKRITPFTEQKRQVAAVVGPEVPKITMLHQLYVATEKVAGSLNYWQRLSFRLEQANLPLRTAEVVYIQMASAILLAAISSLLFGQQGIGALIALVIGGAIPWLYVKLMARRRMNAFEMQLPETLITLAASLKAGHAFNSALQSVVKEGAEPTSTELARVSSEIQLGMASEQALDAMAQRMNSTNFGFVVMAVNIQRTVGGSLADILDMVADTVRQRQQFTRKVKALTAQGRMSAYVLLAMPFLMALAIFALNQAYITILFDTTAGNVMIGGALVMMTIGGIVIQRIVSFKG